MTVPSSRNHLPLLALVWALSVVSLGLSANIISTSNQFPNGEYHGVLIQTIFAWAYNSLFTLIYIIGNAVAPRNFFFGAAITFIMLFLGFLQAIVASGSWTSVTSLYGYLDMQTQKKALEGIQWSATFLLFFDCIWVALTYISGQATEAPPPKEEVVHF